MVPAMEHGAMVPTEDTLLYDVVINQEEEYSIWRVGKRMPAGWLAVGIRGYKQDCLAAIEHIWQDMRPLSLRRFMAEMPLQLSDLPMPQPCDRTDGQTGLVERLSQGEHPVRLVLNGEHPREMFRNCLDLGYVRVCFTQTRGQTIFSLILDDTQTRTQMTPGSDRAYAHLVGHINLDGKACLCVLDIDLVSFTGQGRLQPVAVEEGRLRSA
jgi:uncharacterized protein YbdZ (MbtH family)